MKNNFRQSPINIESNETIRIDSHDLLSIGYHNVVNCRVKHDGRFLRLSNFQNQTVRYRNRDYHLIDIHYHGPSEHKIDGQSTAIECHMVHANQEDNGFLVLGIMIEPCDSSGSDHGVIFNNIPQPNQTRDIKLGLNNLGTQGGFYTYAGSLTTPPYTENVQWVVFKQKHMVSSDLIRKYRNAFPKNNRKCCSCSNIFVFEKN